MGLDASVTVAWLLKRVDPREAGIASDALDRLNESGAAVPAIWSSEVANAVLLAERKRLVTASEGITFCANLGLWDIVSVPAPIGQQLATIMDAARLYRLTAYDASYLELAIRRNAPLATFDRQLAEAARAAGVSIFGDEV